MTAPIHDEEAATPAPRAAQPAQAANLDPPTVRLPKPTRDDRRTEIVDRLLDALEDLVARHRALAGNPAQVDLHAELIAAEVAHELSVTRSALRRAPHLRRTG
ncbi:hypothetical protein LWC33_08945 [Pseudonocardia sp. RS11V-5]|uniref:hypothetical protein n=1 Tax=Pseudonocardia terrae TaxID=2905831 RepID=UPI001E4B004B|nr:hypothetical protein [Pseudonocardia terrae]MCE3551579.1 hypothetical protein [Pseudonocardia terrae]